MEEPIVYLLGAVYHGLKELTLADLFQPFSAYGRAVAAGERGIATHVATVQETERWLAQEQLEDFVYDRRGTIETTLDALATEAGKAGGADGMDIAAIRAQREPMNQIVTDIDRELKRLAGEPDRAAMVELLRELRTHLFDLGAAVTALVALEKEPPTRQPAAEIAAKAEMVELLVEMVKLHLSGPMYRQLLTEADAYRQGRRVQSAWGATPPR